jgi:hypothetical protein
MLFIGLKKRVKIGKFPIEIEQEQAISPAYRQGIEQLIKRDLHPQA